MTPAQLKSFLDRLDKLFDGLILKSALSTKLVPMQDNRLGSHGDDLVLVSLKTDASLFVAARPGAAPETPTEWVERRSKDTAFVAAARKRLVENGKSEEQVAKLAAGQIILMDEKRWYDADRDEKWKLRNQPFWVAEKYLKRLTKQERNKWLFSRLNSAEVPIIESRARLEQHFALFRHVEALRLYAAEHGKLPAQLSDIALPLPVDPFTGAPFLYEVAGRKAILRGTPPRGKEKRAEFNVVYEVTVTE
jgi:hypothetical protein